MFKKIEEYRQPLVNELVSQVVFNPETPNHILNDKGHIKHLLERQIAREVAKRCYYVDYKRSLTSGRIYSGAYNYTPAQDPICETVFEARFTEYSEALRRIKYLEDENQALRSTVFGLKEMIK